MKAPEPALVDPPEKHVTTSYNSGLKIIGIVPQFRISGKKWYPDAHIKLKQWRIHDSDAKVDTRALLEIRNNNKNKRKNIKHDLKLPILNFNPPQNHKQKDPKPTTPISRKKPIIIIGRQPIRWVKSFKRTIIII